MIRTALRRSVSQTYRSAVARPFTTTVAAATITTSASSLTTRTRTKTTPTDLCARNGPAALRTSVRSVIPRITARAYSAGGALDREEVKSRIINLLSAFDKVNNSAKITEKSHFANDLGLDSLDTVEVVMAIEEEFSIEIPDKDADTIHSVDKAIEYILGQPDAH